MIKNATFISIWDDGIEIESNCEVDTDTKEVFNIETVNVGDDFNMLIEEFVEIDGENYPVCNEDEYDGIGFYYY